MDFGAVDLGGMRDLSTPCIIWGLSHPRLTLMYGCMRLMAHEYVMVYVDDLAVALKDPKTFMDLLINRYHFKLKGVGPLSYYLGCDYVHEADGTLYYGTRKYIKKMIANYKCMFGSKPTPRCLALTKGDHLVKALVKEVYQEKDCYLQMYVWVQTNSQVFATQEGRSSGTR